ncbi:hypothetical protein [Chitinophaga defluvii]|uniref:Uncharacterized protein n=1 Tax=Chitinophaga defluvii TaxID=3163343 RepID=A0ABV2T7I0_9BACT
MRKMALRTPEVHPKKTNNTFTANASASIVTRLRKIRIRTAAPNTPPGRTNLPAGMPDYGPWTMNHGPWID